MMDGWVNAKIGSFHIPEVHFLDIQQLNEAAIRNQYDVTKISAAAYPQVAKDYDILDAGAAMGFGSGPLLVSRPDFGLSKLEKAIVAIPGQHTTAHYLFNLFYRGKGKKEFMLFSEIEDAILDGRVDAGVIIHESRFTYMQKGLAKLADLGVLWEKAYQLPLPLGIMVCRKKFPENLKKQINDTIKSSIQFAFNNPLSSHNFVLEYGQEMDPEIADKHIKLYVNSFSLSMGADGKRAINFLILQSQNKPE